jgi:hypothetical protein
MPSQREDRRVGPGTAQGAGRPHEREQLIEKYDRAAKEEAKGNGRPHCPDKSSCRDHQEGNEGFSLHFKHLRYDEFSRSLG